MRARPSLFASCLILLAALAGAAGAQTHPSLKDAALPPLLPISLMASGDPDTRTHFQVSPDGKSLAWLQRVGGRRQIHMRPLDGGDYVVIPTAQDIGSYRWTADSRHFALSVDPVPGAENFQVILVDSQTPKATPRNVTPWPGTRNSVLVLNGMPGSLYIFSNRRDRRFFDLYRLALPVNGEPQLVARNPGTIARWFFDSTGRIVARTTRPDAEGRSVFERCQGNACTRLFETGLEDFVNVVGDADASSVAWALSNRERDKAALVRLDLTTGAETVVHADPAVDVSAVRLSPGYEKAVYAVSWPDRQKVHFFDPAVEAALRPLLSDGFDTIGIASADMAQRWLVVTLSGPMKATHTILLDRQTGRRSPLTVSPWEEWRQSLSPTEPHAFQARDGRTIPAYVTIPRGTSGRKLPTVMLVHGGPWSRDYGMMSPQVQFLANRGYAVVQVNFRGSSGYGKAHLWSAVGEFGRKMSDDVDDAAAWAVQRGIADPDRIAIMGGSYGGYATMVGMTRTPLLYAAGISNVGLSDLPAFMDLLPEYWDPQRWQRFLGKPGDVAARARMWDVSPLRLADKVERPVLIFHGANDPRVRRDQSERFAGALRSFGKPVEFHLFTDEGHNLSRPANRARFYAMVERFLARHLGGRASPATSERRQGSDSTGLDNAPGGEPRRPPDPDGRRPQP
jgi:dipeptidyl aminopeptidase/acylaminoacyl peptidase